MDGLASVKVEMRNFCLKTENWIIWGVAILAAYLPIRVLLFGFYPLTSMILSSLFSILFFAYANYQYGYIERIEYIPKNKLSLFYKKWSRPYLKREKKMMFFFLIGMFICADIAPDINKLLDQLFGLDSNELKKEPNIYITALFIIINLIFFELVGLLIRYNNNIKSILNEPYWIKWLHAVMCLVMLLCGVLLFYADK